jgi:HAE1 family hydrophobic/amphiphilic exporter-1
MLVDNSIVVLEAITQQREKGLSMLDAAREGAREVAGAISGSTLTTVAVFAPIIFVHGIAGRIFGDQALTVVTSLLVSLLVAVMFIPMLASRQFGIAAASTAAAGPAASLPAAGTQGDASGAARWLGVGQIWGVRIFAWLSLLIAWILRGLGFVLGRLLAPLHWLHDKAYHAVERGYVSLLARSLRSPWKIVLIATGVSAIALTRVGSLGLDLLPEVHQGEFTAWVSLDVGTPLARTDDAMRRIEREVRGIDGVELTALTVGVEPDTLSREIEGKHTARLTVRLRQDRVNEAEEERAVAAVRAVFAREPLVRSVDIKRSTPFALEAPVEVEVLGYDLARIEAVAADVQRRMAGIEGLSDVRTTSRPGFPEARIRFDRDKVLEYGLDLRAVSTLVRDQVLGNVSTRFNEGDDRIDVRVIGDEAVLSSLDRVLDLEVNPAASNPVPLSAIASVETLAGPAEIRRIGNTRAVVVSAESSGLDLGNMAAKIAAALDGMKTPDDVLVQIGGQKREMEAAQSSMRFALILALFLVYAVMACLFESLVQPLIVMITVPLAAVGVVYTLDWLDIPLSVIVFIGLILLAGIVVNNAIVLLERTNQLRETGLSVLAAQEETCRTRLRPIYMTTATTVLGLLPMTGWLGGIPGLAALGAGEGAELREPLAITVIAGLSVSTLLTLLVVPCLYQIVYGRKQRS